MINAAYGLGGLGALGLIKVRGLAIWEFPKIGDPNTVP